MTDPHFYCGSADERAALSIDADRSTYLAHVGGVPGYAACTVIAPNGDELLVLVDEASLGTAAPAWVTDWRDVAPHELTGRLPKAYAPRCGRPALPKLRPCRRLVTVHGDTCDGHRHLAHVPPAPYTAHRPPPTAEEGHR